MFARRNRRDAGRSVGSFEPGDLCRKSVPGRESTGRHVIDAAGASECRNTVTAQELRGSLGQRPGGGRSSDLIGYDAQFFLFVKQTPNSKKEILAARRVHPARAQYQMSAADVMDRLLSRELAAAVSVEGIGAVLLDIWRIFRSIEDVIGRIMDKQRLSALRFLGQDGHGGR